MSIISSGSKLIEQNMGSALECRLSSAVQKTTKQLNKLAIQGTKSDRMVYTFSKATPEDLRRLTSKSIEDSYKRVTWTNPKDSKVYHILEESRNNGKVQVRILDKDGEFVKNAELTPKNIVIFDNFFSPRGITHGEMMEVFVKRFNPFANVERLEHKKGWIENIRYRGRLPMHLELKRFRELEKAMQDGKKVDYISVSEANLLNGEDIIRQTGANQKGYIAMSPDILAIRPVFENIMKRGTRIFEAAGNDSQYAPILISDRLAIDGVEGVGSLYKGKIAKDSCSRNSVFTQHYEKRDYLCRFVKDNNGKVMGVNVTGLSGVDMPINFKTKKMTGMRGGTSYATPVRVAKISLNDMMEGIL